MLVRLYGQAISKQKINSIESGPQDQEGHRIAGHKINKCPGHCIMGRKNNKGHHVYIGLQNQ